MAGPTPPEKSGGAAGQAVLAPLQEEFDQTGAKGPNLHPEKR